MYLDNTVRLPIAPITDEGMPQDWQAKLFFEITKSGYTIKTANSQAEFQQVLDLRREVFLEEFASNDLSDDSDYESIDNDADFLMILHGDQVVASYRLIFSEHSKNFYSKSEFNVSQFIARGEKVLELSRACVRKNCRAGIAIHLLWRGIAEYMKLSGARYLFGCSSVQTLNVEDVIKIYRYFKQEDILSKDLSISPLSKYNLINVDAFGSDIEDQDTPRLDGSLVPPLLNAYIKAGAKVYGAPAVDLRFGCVDFFTVLDFQKLAKPFVRKYVG